MDLPLADFVFYLVIASFLAVPILSVISRALHVRMERRSSANRIICRLCLHAYEDTSHVGTVNCPVCHACNEKGRSRRLG
jgi:protein-arginine kinase activator protein McsA